MKHPPLWVVRGCSIDDWNDYGVTKPEDLFNLIGKTCVFKGFTSSSVSSIEDSPREVHRYIYVPEKVKGGYLNSNSEYAHENEFLLDKNTKTHIVKVEIMKNGKVQTVEEVIV